ncbi:hypothetical protein Mapa_013802 [Marchantia paleacea]|nr:hypothetical protein Mapa_013802 [Marchantia paleacea]
MSDRFWETRTLIKDVWKESVSADITVLSLQISSFACPLNTILSTFCGYLRPAGSCIYLPEKLRTDQSSTRKLCRIVICAVPSAAG